MDKKQLQARIDQESRNERRRTSYVNSLMEDLYFSDYEPRKLLSSESEGSDRAAAVGA